MKVTHRRLSRFRLEGTLLGSLLGRVFHVTSRDAWKGIRATGTIEPNHDGRFPFTFSQSAVSMFRKRGCVSVFDLRDVRPGEELSLALLKYYFLNPEHVDDRPVFLFLAEHTWDCLESWKTMTSFKDMLIPFVEAGHPGPIALSDISERLMVSVYGPDPREAVMQSLVEVLSRNTDST